MKKKYKIKKYVAGVQNTSVDPTALYGKNRNTGLEGTSADQFDNSQNAILGQTQTLDKYNTNNTQAGDNYDSFLKDSASKRATMQAGVSKIPVVGGLVSGLMKVGGGIGDKLNTKSYEKAIKGENNKGTQQASLMLTDTGSKLAAAKSGVDVAEAFVPINGLFGQSSQDIAEAKSLEAKNQNESIEKQKAKYGAIDENRQTMQAKNGKKDIVLNNLIKGHSKNYKTIESKESPKLEKQELSKFKQLKKLESHEAREIETEGREPIFSPKKTDGSRDLLYYNPSDPTHAEGGVAAKVIPKSESKYKTKNEGSKLEIPEGSAIVTANKGKNKEAIQAYKKGNYKLVNKIIDKMPEDSPKKKQAGDGNVGPLKNKEPYEPTYLGMKGSDFNKTPGATTTDTVDTYSTSSSNKLDGLVGAGTGLYNIAKGAFGKTTKTNRRLYTPELYKSTDNTKPLIREANEQYRVSSDNIKNGTGGAGASYLSNQALASANRFKNVSDIKTNQASKDQDITNQNVGLRNSAKLGNIEANNNYDQMDLQNAGKKSEYIGKGLEQLGESAQMGILNKNRQTSDDIKLKNIGTTNFVYNEKGEKVAREKKGVKNLKYKIKK